MKLFTITALICLIVIVSATWSATIHVATWGDDDEGDGSPENPYRTIQRGIDIAVDGDTVLVHDGTYSGEGNIYLQINQPFLHEKNIIVESENGYEHTTIDCSEGDPGPGKKRGAFTFNESGEDERTIISGFTMTGGYKPNGGAIACVNASPTITNNKIIGNTACDGGGGAIVCQSASPIITDNIITENSAAKGTCPEFSDIPDIEPEAEKGNGGAIACDANSSPIISNNQITDNDAMTSGGAIFSNYSSPQIINNKIIGNSAEKKGGGVAFNGSSNPLLINNIIAENSALSDIGGIGGGILGAYYAEPTIIYNTITQNSAGNKGGGIVCVDDSIMTVINTILWDNIAPTSSQILDDATLLVTYSDIQDGWEGEGNINLDPLLYADYHLTDYSPCIGAGKDTHDITDDIDDEPRPRPDGSNPDMGADENGRETPLPRGDVSANEIVTAFDASLTLQHVVGLINLSEGQQKGADVTDNKIVTALDAALILQYTVGLITMFPAEYDNGAPILNAKSENELLSDAINTLEKVSLDREQREVIKQLNRYLVGNILPTHTNLLQNYPNPFNPETWLPYQLAQDALVTIHIYNSKGQLIRLLRLGTKQSGNYMTKERAAYWDGRDNLGQRVASGVYFYTLHVEYPRGEIERCMGTRRMVILK